MKLYQLTDKGKTHLDNLTPYIEEYQSICQATFAKNPVHVQSLMDSLGGLPVVGKLLKGSQGQGVMIFRDPEQTNTSLESFWKLNIDVMMQRYIESDRKDIRAIVVGEKVAVAMERSGKKDFRANISQGGSGRLIELTKEQEQICVNASKALGLSFSGVDLMKDANGKNYIIEVNGNPGTKIIDITGHNYFDDLVAFIETQTGNPSANKDTTADRGNLTDTEEESKDPNKFALRHWKRHHAYR